ncbi:MAG: CYTH domain-containing protein [Rhodoferax sp.]
MGVEIERKFLVQGEGWRAGTPGVLMRQGYLCCDKERTVRVRQAGAEAFLTIKGAPQGLVRAEFEYPIPLADAQALLALCDGPLVEKTRFERWVDGTLWEVDEFHGDNAPLVLAEVELPSAEASFARPPWLGAEVSEDTRYLNACLAQHPFARWGR